MKQRICAHNPAQAEYSLCGMAFDAYASGDAETEHVIATDVCKNVNCDECKRILADLFKTYTESGRLRK